MRQCSRRRSAWCVPATQLTAPISRRCAAASRAGALAAGGARWRRAVPRAATPEAVAGRWQRRDARGADAQRERVQKAARRAQSRHARCGVLGAHQGTHSLADANSQPRLRTPRRQSSTCRGFLGCVCVARCFSVEWRSRAAALHHRVQPWYRKAQRTSFHAAQPCHFIAPPLARPGAAAGRETFLQAPRACLLHGLSLLRDAPATKRRLTWHLLHMPHAWSRGRQRRALLRQEGVAWWRGTSWPSSEPPSKQLRHAYDVRTLREHCMSG